MHMGLGEPRTIPDRLEQARIHIEKAVECDPENVIYASYAGDVLMMHAYMALMKGEADAKEKVEKVCEQYESTLELKPDYREVMLSGIGLHLSEDRRAIRSHLIQVSVDLVIHTKYLYR